MRSSLIYILVLFALSPNLTGQDRGYFSGSLESRNHFYYDDKQLNINRPQDRFGTNNYLWIQYINGPVSFGVQYEAFMPPLVGYPYQFEGSYISHRFIRFEKGIIDVTAGNFYDQFGSGLSFRAYEERSLGVNSSLDGIRVIIKPAPWISLKSLYGRPRRFADYADSYIRGSDGEIDLGILLKTDNSLLIGGGFISRYSPYFGPDPDFPSTVNALNSRMSFQLEKFSFSSEFVSKSADPDAMNLFSANDGKALSMNSTYASGRLGLFVALRFLKEMNFQTERSFTDGYSSVNYLPANTRQYTYALSNIYPYSTQADGEAALRTEINYSFQGNKSEGGYGADLRFNFSQANSLAETTDGQAIAISLGDQKYYQDINFEVQKKWSRKFKSIVALQSIYFDRGVIEGSSGNDVIKSKILITDIQARLTTRVSVRTELQHLWSDQDHRNWMSILSELNYAPHWSVYISDMTDYEYSDQVHYYSFGISYRVDYMNIGFGYGRNREGYICSGGICRKIPAYKGFNISLSTSF